MGTQRSRRLRSAACGALILLPLLPGPATAPAGADPGACVARTFIAGVDLGCLTDNLFVFTDGSKDANWQSSSKGYAGNVAIDGFSARERTSGTFAYAGTITTNDSDLGAWEKIVGANSGQATSAADDTVGIDDLSTTLGAAIAEIGARTATPGYEARSAQSLDGLDTRNGFTDQVVINVTSGLKVSTRITVFGDAADIYLLRWDTDGDARNGLQGQVKFQSGGAIVPAGELTPANFLHIAGDMTASGGGSTPPSPYPQGPRLGSGTGPLITGGSDFNGGGFFTGYWLTTGSPQTGKTSSMSNAVFVGGWYSLTNEFSMTSGTSGVHVAPPAGGGGGGGGT